MPLKAHICKKPKDILTSDEIERIHRGTLDILSDVGVVFAGEKALDILESGGCDVDRASGRVRFPGQPGRGMHRALPRRVCHQGQAP